MNSGVIRFQFPIIPFSVWCLLAKRREFRGNLGRIAGFPGRSKKSPLCPSHQLQREGTYYYIRAEYNQFGFHLTVTYVTFLKYFTIIYTNPV